MMSGHKSVIAAVLGDLARSVSAVVSASHGSVQLGAAPLALAEGDEDEEDGEDHSEEGRAERYSDGDADGELHEVEYVLDGIVPFLVTYFHSVFRLDSASPGEVAASNQLFDLCFALADTITRTPAHSHTHARALRRQRRAAEAKEATGGAASAAMTTLPPAQTHVCTAVQLDNLLNCLVHMYDPEVSRCLAVFLWRCVRCSPFCMFALINPRAERCRAAFAVRA